MFLVCAQLCFLCAYTVFVFFVCVCAFCLHTCAYLCFSFVLTAVAVVSGGQQCSSGHRLAQSVFLSNVQPLVHGAYVVLFIVEDLERQVRGEGRRLARVNVELHAADNACWLFLRHELARCNVLVCEKKLQVLFAVRATSAGE